MRLSSRALALLIVYFFLVSYPVTWAGDNSPSRQAGAYVRATIVEGNLVADNDPEEARLRRLVVENQADPQAHYQYATYLCQHQLDSKSGISYQDHLLIAAEAGHVEATRQLLNRFKPGYYPSAGLVFFQLYQLGCEGQVVFSQGTLARFLALAIEAGDIGALAYLDKLTYDALKNNRKSRQNRRHLEWRNVRHQWIQFENRSGRINQLMTEIDGMYKTGVHQRLSLLEELCPFYHLDTGNNDEDSSQSLLVCQQRQKLNKRTIEEFQTELDMARIGKQPKVDTDVQPQALNVEPQTDRGVELTTQQEIAAGLCLVRLQVEKAQRIQEEAIKFQLSQAGELDFGLAAVPEGCLPRDFFPLQGSQDTHSDEYGHYIHKIAGIHVWIPSFVYRVGKSASVTLCQKYGAHAIEVMDLGGYLARFDARVCAYLIERFAQGQQGVGGWQLPRAFVNAGVVQAGFFMQKYLASKHVNGRSVTSADQTEPLSLIRINGHTCSEDMLNCHGWLDDAYVLAKHTSTVHQVASIFQYSALAMLALAQAQATNQDTSTWCSHNGQANGVMCLGNLHEVAGGVTTVVDDTGAKTLYILGRKVDYINLTKSTASGPKNMLLARGDKAFVWPDWRMAQLTGHFPLFSGDPTWDALGLPKSIQAQGNPWCVYGNSPLYQGFTLSGLMLVVGGWESRGVVGNLCARTWDFAFLSRSARFRLSAYGCTWRAFAKASSGLPDDR